MYISRFFEAEYYAKEELLNLRGSAYPLQIVSHFVIDQLTCFSGYAALLAFVIDQYTNISCLGVK